MRLKLLKKLIFVSFLFLTFSLVYNQLVRGPYYFRLSQNNRIKLIRLKAARGVIYDREGEVLADTRPSFNAGLLAQEIEDVQQTIDKISPILGISKNELLRRFKKNFSAPFIPVVIARDIPKKTAIILECSESDIPGLVIQTENLRNYRYEESLGHILGYLGRVKEEELSRFKTYGLPGLPDLVGRTGVEERFDRYLRGQAGGMQVEVNNRGYLVRVLGSRQPQTGSDIYLTVDAQLQKLVDTLLEEEKGACIVMNPQNGEISALVSKPSFAPSLFIAAANGKQEAARRIEGLLNSKEAVLVNRAISASFPPGSIFKIVVAAAALENDIITPNSTFNCSGSLNVGNREFFCWNLDGHGGENIYSGLAHSCNVFFYKLGLSLGADKLSTYARKLGLGQTTNIDLPYESKGFVPTKNWKLKTYQERWYDGETANFSIGQGYLLATPLQIVQMVSVIANGGYLVRPHIVKRLGKQESRILRKKLVLERETIETIKEGLRRVIQDEEGTGHNARISGLEWAGKTGTAQVSSGWSHGWFAGFYPLKQPRVLVLVFLENGGSGGETPARIAKEIIKYIRDNEEKL